MIILYYSFIYSALLRGRSLYADQTGFELSVFLPWPSQRWDHRWGPSSPDLLCHLSISTVPSVPIHPSSTIHSHRTFPVWIEVDKGSHHRKGMFGLQFVLVSAQLRWFLFCFVSLFSGNLSKSSSTEILCVIRKCIWAVFPSYLPCAGSDWVLRALMCAKWNHCSSSVVALMNYDRLTWMNHKVRPGRLDCCQVRRR